MTGSQGRGPTTQAADEADNKSLNFRVTPEFKKEFKGFAGSQGITMTELLKEGFSLVKKNRLR